MPIHLSLDLSDLPFTPHSHETLHPRGRGAPPPPPPPPPPTTRTASSSDPGPPGAHTASSRGSSSSPAAYHSQPHLSPAPTHQPHNQPHNHLDHTHLSRSRGHFARGRHGAAGGPRRRAFLSRSCVGRWLVPYHDQVTALHVSHTELRSTVVPVVAAAGGGGRGAGGWRGGGGGGGMRHDLQVGLTSNTRMGRGGAVVGLKGLHSARPPFHLRAVRQVPPHRTRTVHWCMHGVGPCPACVLPCGHMQGVGWGGVGVLVCGGHTSLTASAARCLWRSRPPPRPLRPHPRGCLCRSLMGPLNVWNCS